MSQARYLVAAVLLFFAWKDANVSVLWPPAQVEIAPSEKPSAEKLAWAKQLRGKVAGMLPKDRIYLASFYDAVLFVLAQDGRRAQPLVSNTEKFAAFHANSLQLAIEKGNVGKYPGLDDAIDAVFFSAAGPDVKEVDAATRTQLSDAAAVLAWVFRIRADE